jgi:hypothetical protein
MFEDALYPESADPVEEDGEVVVIGGLGRRQLIGDVDVAGGGENIVIAGDGLLNGGGGHKELAAVTKRRRLSFD